MISIALICGMAIALQSVMSAQLGRYLGHPMFATFVVFAMSALLMGMIVLGVKFKLPSMVVIRAVPPYLWILGSVLSALSLTTIYWLMPQIGVPRVMVGVLAGQVIVSMIAGHYGWFGMPVMQMTGLKFMGVFILVVGVLMINFEGVS